MDELPPRHDAAPAARWLPPGTFAGQVAVVTGGGTGPFFSAGAQQNLWPAEEIEQRLQEHVPLGRFATASEIAAHCLHQLCPASGWMTGECLVVDGGASLARGWWTPGERTTRKPRA